MTRLPVTASYNNYTVKTSRTLSALCNHRTPRDRRDLICSQCPCRGRVSWLQAWTPLQHAEFCFHLPRSFCDACWMQAYLIYLFALRLLRVSEGCWHFAQTWWVVVRYHNPRGWDPREWAGGKALGRGRVLIIVEKESFPAASVTGSPNLEETLEMTSPRNWCFNQLITGGLGRWFGFLEIWKAVEWSRKISNMSAWDCTLQAL